MRTGLSVVALAVVMDHVFRGAVPKVLPDPQISGFLPRINNVDPARLEVSGIARSQRSVSGARDGCDLAVELADRDSGCSSFSSDACEGFGCGAVERQDSAAEIVPKYLVHSFGDCGAAPALGHYCDSVSEFRFGDGCNEHGAAILGCKPGHHFLFW